MRGVEILDKLRPIDWVTELGSCVTFEVIDHLIPGLNGGSKWIGLSFVSLKELRDRSLNLGLERTASQSSPNGGSCR